MLESERWPRARLLEWQRDRLAELGAVARGTGFYRPRLPERLDLDSLAEVEPLTRGDLQERAGQLDTGIEGPRIEWFTSGTSGRPVRVEHGPEVLGFNVASRWRHQTRFGLPPRPVSEAGFEVKAAPGGPPIRSVGDDPPLFLLNHWTLGPDQLAEAHRMIVDAGGAEMTGAWPSMVASWAHLYERSDLDPLELGIQLCAHGAETATDEHRADISRVLGCQLGEMYGMREVAIIASQCQHGSLHINDERVLVEILDLDGNRLPAGERGEIVVTLLHSYEMPLIRYRTGDAGSLVSGPCECGLTLGRLELGVGRLQDMVMRSDGTLVNARFVRAVLESEFGAGLIAHRAEQTGRGSMRVQLEFRVDPPPDLRRRIERGLEAHLGEPVAVDVELGPVPQHKPGEKLRSFIRSWDGP